MLQEFWFTAAATFFYFTAFVAILSAFVGYEDEEYQYWIDANIAAGVGHQCAVKIRSLIPFYILQVFGLFNNVVYAAPVIAGENLPPSWNGEFRTRQGTIQNYPELIAKEVAKRDVPKIVKAVQRRVS